MIALLISLALVIKSIHGAGRVYNAINELKTADEARIYCQDNYKTTLATVIDDGDYAAIRAAKTAASIGTSDSVWVGLADSGTEHTFEWQDGTQCIYPDSGVCISSGVGVYPWGEYEPNNADLSTDQTGEDCVELFSDYGDINNDPSRPVWFNDVPCNEADYKRRPACNACVGCDENAFCDNSDGPYQCQCNTGYSGDGLECNDVDECTENTFSCTANSHCINTAGGYDCECDDGYEKDAGGACMDINECITGNNPCVNGVCTNVAGTYECECDPGYEVVTTSGSETCQDINECENANLLSLCGDETICVNLEGSFECQGDCKDIIISCDDGQTRECNQDIGGDLRCRCIDDSVIATSPFIPSNYPFITLLIICLSIFNVILLYIVFCGKNTKQSRKKRGYTPVIHANSDEFSESEAKAINI